MTTLPHSHEAEQTVVGAMLARPKLIGEVIGTMVQAEHFHYPGLRVLFNTAVDAYFSDGAMDPVSIVDRAGGKLPEPWGGDRDYAVEQLRALVGRVNPNDAVPHAKIVKRDADRRALLGLAADIQARAQDTANSPEQLAAETSQRAMQVATNAVLTNEILSYRELGVRFVQRQRELRAAREQGIELGVFFGQRFLDERLHGLKPTELMVLAGEPGAGKSGVAFTATRQFAERQMAKPKEKRLAAFILSLEMGEEPAGDRFGQNEGGVDGAKLRDGTADDDELARIIKNWKLRADIPLYFNFTSMIRAAQLRALIVEAIRRYGVNLVVIDHMRYFDADRRFDNAADEDEAKSRFLKEDIAKTLNVAVIVLAHTTKAVDGVDDRRPRLSHLRGGGMVAAHADFVAFMYRPYMHADTDKVLEGEVSATDAELIWAKNRHGLADTTYFYFDPSLMFTRDLI